MKRWISLPEGEPLFSPAGIRESKKLAKAVAQYEDVIIGHHKGNEVIVIDFPDDGEVMRFEMVHGIKTHPCQQGKRLSTSANSFMLNLIDARRDAA